MLKVGQISNSYFQCSSSTIECRSTRFDGIRVIYTNWIKTDGKRVNVTRFIQTTATTRLGAMIQVARRLRQWQGRYAQYEFIELTENHTTVSVIYLANVDSDE